MLCLNSDGRSAPFSLLSLMPIDAAKMDSGMRRNDGSGLLLLLLETAEDHSLQMNW